MEPLLSACGLHPLSRNVPRCVGGKWEGLLPSVKPQAELSLGLGRAPVLDKD